MGAQVDFQISDNVPWTFEITFEDLSGVGIDLTGSTFKLMLKVTAAGSAVQTLTSGSGIVHDDLSAGEISLVFPSGIAPGDYVHDLLRIASGAPVEQMWSGSLTCEKGVTT